MKGERKAFEEAVFKCTESVSVAKTECQKIKKNIKQTSCVRLHCSDKSYGKYRVRGFMKRGEEAS